MPQSTAGRARVYRLGVLRPVFLAVLVGALTGCGTTYLDSFLCTNPDRTHLDESGEPDPCHEHDADAGGAGDAGHPCTGECLPLGPNEWTKPELLWIGAEADAPACPASAPIRNDQFHADLVAPVTCGACTCAPSTGACSLPTSIKAYNKPLCSSSVSPTSYDPPAGWGGTCTAANAIPAGQIQSVSIAPLMLTDNGCAPIEPMNVQEPATWSTYVLVCSGAQTACGVDTTCAPIPPPDSGFRQCISQKGEPKVLECPKTYPDRHVVYDGVDDQRVCSPCTCGTPAGGKCAGSISFFNDGACSTGPILTLTATSDAIACGSVPLGSALGSKAAGPVTYTPSTCEASGGVPADTAKLVGPSIFCCLP